MLYVVPRAMHPLTRCPHYVSGTANCALFVSGNLCYTEVLGKLFQLSTTRTTYTKGVFIVPVYTVQRLAG